MFLAADTAATGSSGIMNMVLPFVLMFAVFYFLLIRPNQKKQKTRGMMMANIKKGDKIITIGGLHGTITELMDDTIVIRVNDVTKLTFDKSAINTVIPQAEEKDSK